MEFILISGMSGAGKSKAASFMEDMDFFCVDNLPAPLISKFAELGMAGSGEYERVVLVTDVRSGTSFDGLFQALDALKEMKCSYRILFMDASDETIIKRYKETRRSHPLVDDGISLEQAIPKEREMLRPLRERAEYIIDTSALSTAKLKGELRRLFARGEQSQGRMDLRILSFGFKHGVPMEADLVFDVRFLPNPYYLAELRQKTGLDTAVRDYVFSTPTAHEFFARLTDFTDWLLPRYEEEGKSVLVIAVGCTGGHHRSVAVAHALAGHYRSQGVSVSENHRDLGYN